MSFEEEIEKIQDLKTRIAHYRNFHDDFSKRKAKELANKIIVDKITNLMQAEEFSEKIWKNTFLSDDVQIDSYKGKIHLNVRSVYKTESGFDVALAREHGTKRHWIAPRVKLALSWITQGIRLFSKGHYVSGIKSLHIIEDTVKANKEELQREFTKEMLKWKQQILPEIVNPERAS